MTYQTERDEMNVSVNEYADIITDINRGEANVEIDEYVAALKAAAHTRSQLEGVPILKLGDEIEDTFFSDGLKITPARRDLVKRSQGLKIKPKGAYIMKVDTRYLHSSTWNETENAFIDTTNTSKTINLGYSGSFIVDWGDGTINGAASHTYEVDGVYDIAVTGTVESSAIGKDFIKEVIQFGDQCVFSSISYLFYNASGLTKLPTGDYPTVAENCSAIGVFTNAYSFNQSVNHWDISKYSDIRYFFQNAKTFNQPLDQWDVGHLAVFQKVFMGCTAFNQPLDSWDMRSSTDISFMFSNCDVFNQPLNSWDVSKVINMSGTFRYAYVFNGIISNWDTSTVVNMSDMFRNCLEFNQNLSNWEVGKVSSMDAMFNGCSLYDKPMNGWDVSNVTNMRNMFRGNAVLNQPLNGWNTLNVVRMDYMFYYTPAFSQDLSEWNVGKVTIHTNFTYLTGMTAEQLPVF